MIAEVSADSHLSNSIQCVPAYCNQEPGSDRITVRLRNVSAKKITVPGRAVIHQIQLATMVPTFYALVGQMSTEAKQEEDGSWIVEKLDLEGLHLWTEEQQQAAKDLLCRPADVFSKVIWIFVSIIH